MRGKRIALIPQAASSALNRALRIGTQLREAWKAHSGVAWSSELGRVKGLLRSCGLPDDDPFLNRYPDQISLGQAQRVLIVMALLHHPTLLIADEPTSALDVHTQREVLDLFKRINREQRMSVLFISHDLSVVAALCQTNCYPPRRRYCRIRTREHGSCFSIACVHPEIGGCREELSIDRTVSFSPAG